MKAIVNAAVCPLKAEPKWESTLADEVLSGMVVDILEEAAAAKAVQNAAQCKVPMPEHFHIEVDFIKHHVAYSRSFYPGASLKDGKFVCFDSDDWYEVLRFCHFVLSD